jgi:hypothetical protein
VRRRLAPIVALGITITLASCSDPNDTFPGTVDYEQQAAGAGYALCANFTVTELRQRFRLIGEDSDDFPLELARRYFPDAPEGENPDVRDAFASTCAHALRSGKRP